MSDLNAARKLVNFVILKKLMVLQENWARRTERLAIGIAIATEPKLLLLDELMGGINIEEINHLMEIIEKFGIKGLPMSD